MDWTALLKQHRKDRRLTQLELARRAGLSVATVRSYEGGARRPKQQAVQALIDGLGLTGEEATALLDAAGFSPRLHRTMEERYGPLTIDYLQEEVAARPWPAFVTNQAFEVVAQNPLFEQLMGVDLTREFTGFAERSFVGGIVDPNFGGRMENWDEVVTFMIGLVKGDPRRSEDDDRPLPWLEAPIQRLVAGKPEMIRRFVELWEGAPAVPHRLRQYFPLRWRYDDITLLSFHCTLALADAHTELHYNEWVPADGRTWRWVEDGGPRGALP